MLGKKSFSIWVDISRFPTQYWSRLHSWKTVHIEKKKKKKKKKLAYLEIQLTLTRHTIGDLLSFNESTISIVGKNSTSLQWWITHSSMVTGLRDAISLNVYLNVTFESIQCIHAMSKSEKKAHNYPQAPYAKDREGNCLWHMGLEIIFRSCPTCQSTSTRYEGLKKASNVCAWLLILTP